MCGIAGLVSRTAIPETLIDRVPAVARCLDHRGPDDTGYLWYSSGKVRSGREWNFSGPSPQVVFVHKRLAILDLTESGWQPMGTEGSYFIVFNGEIYNYVEIRKELESLGHPFQSKSDTEVLLRAYVEWGNAALSRLVGMFAFAILDLTRRTVMLARDFFGIKPLYFVVAPDCIAFASETKALLEMAISNRNANASRLYLYLRFGISDHGSETLMSDIRQLPPASYMELSLDGAQNREPVTYWKPFQEDNAQSRISFDEAAEQLRALFFESVHLHLRSDVPIGTALSGGIDSSSIVMAMRHLEPNANLHAFSYVADDSSIGEERWIDLVGNASGADVHKVYADSGEMVNDLDLLTYAQDEPFGSTSLYAQYCVFRKAQSAGIKVMLDGQGADEMLGGYRYYLAARFASLVRQHRWQEASTFLVRSSQHSNTRTYWLLLRSASYLLPPNIQDQLRKFVGKEILPAWLNERWFTRHGVVPRSFSPPSGANVLTELLSEELLSTSLPHLLRYEDRNSMAFSIESRVPFLTPKLVSFVLALPEHYLIADDGTTKAVFRKAMRGIVPDAILDRRDKVAFATPEGKWLSNLKGWVDRLLSSDLTRNIPVFDHKQLEQEWRRVSQGHRTFDFRVWRWLNTIQWVEQFRVRFD